MKDLNLDKPWSFVSPEKTIDYPAGRHSVTEEIHKAAVTARAAKEEKADGGRITEAGAPRSADTAQG